MSYLDSQEEWENIHLEDLWVYNKLILSKHLGHLCGPTGCPVPYAGYYVVRPSMNLLGMGRFSRIEWVENSTDHLHPAEFWCEIFYGDHVSVDFYKKEARLVVLGEKNNDNPLYKWKKWSKIDKNIPFPAVLNKLKGNYQWINCEFIGNKLIEVHFRRNPDFRFGNSVAIPVWKGQKQENHKNLTFIKDEDYLREGFLIDSWDSNPIKSSDSPNQEKK